MAQRPQPHPVSWDQAFWDGAAEGKLLIQRCADCGHLQFYPRPACVACFSPNLDWQESARTGEVYSYTAVRAPINPAFRDEVPIYLVDVILAEGVRVLARLADSDPETLAIGDQVTIELRPNEPNGVPVPHARTRPGR
jgi:uncharacterized OB-fold protein